MFAWRIWAYFLGIPVKKLFYWQRLNIQKFWQVLSQKVAKIKNFRTFCIYKRKETGEFQLSFSVSVFASAFHVLFAQFALFICPVMSSTPADSAKQIDLVAWDAQMASPKTANYNKLYEEMAKAAKASPDNVEIMWRLAYITYSLSLNLSDENAIKAKAIEAYGIAEKVVAKDANNFNGNLWLAMTAGQLALVGSNIQAKVK